MTSSEMGGRPVAKPIGMREKEIEFDQPFEELVVELYAKHHTYEGVAKVLGISRQTLQIWLRLVGLGSRDLRLGAQERRKKGHDPGPGREP